MSVAFTLAFSLRTRRSLHWSSIVGCRQKSSNIRLMLQLSCKQFPRRGGGLRQCFRKGIRTRGGGAIGDGDSDEDVDSRQHHCCSRRGGGE